MWTHTHTCHISHTNTPFRYLSWSKLSHLGHKFKQEASKQSGVKKKTAWHNDALLCSEAGEAFINSTWEQQRCPFWSTRCTSFEVRELRCESVPDVEQDTCLFLEDLMKHCTLAAAVAQQDTEESTYLSSFVSFFYFRIILYWKKLVSFAYTVLAGVLTFLISNLYNHNI